MQRLQCQRFLHPKLPLTIHGQPMHSSWPYQRKRRPFLRRVGENNIQNSQGWRWKDWRWTTKAFGGTIPFSTHHHLHHLNSTSSPVHPRHVLQLLPNDSSPGASRGHPQGHPTRLHSKTRFLHRHPCLSNRSWEPGRLRKISRVQMAELVETHLGCGKVLTRNA